MSFWGSGVLSTGAGSLCFLYAWFNFVVVAVVVEIIKLYLVQMGRFLATTGYVAPSPSHVQYNVSEIRMYLNVAPHQKGFNLVI